MRGLFVLFVFALFEAVNCNCKISVPGAVKVILRKANQDCSVENQYTSQCIYSTFAIKNKEYSFENIPKGAYFITAIVPDGILLADEKRITVTDEEECHKHVSIVFRDPVYVEPKKPFNIFSFFKNPIFLMLIPGLLGIFLKKMTANIDPRELKEMQGKQTIITADGKDAVHCVNTFRYSNRVDPEDLVPQWPLVSKFREQEEPSDEVKVD